MKTNELKIGSKIKSKVNTQYLNILSTYTIVKQTNTKIFIEHPNGLFGNKYKWLRLPKDTDKLNFTKENFVSKTVKNNFSYVTGYNELENHPLVQSIWDEGEDGVWLNTRTKEEYRDGEHYLHWWWPNTSGYGELTKSQVVYDFNLMVSKYNDEKKSVLDPTW
tara:strand:+ start:211 stop:699 length:489 start_codon:yes stop_codon:yes gene_type:complete